MRENRIVFIALLTIVLILSALGSASANDLTFIVSADPHFGRYATEYFNTTQVEAINSLEGQAYPVSIGGFVSSPSFVIVAGDLLEGGQTPAAWTAEDGFLAHYGLDGSDGLVNYPVFECRGNHDVGNDQIYCSDCTKTWITQRHGNFYYSFNVNGIHFVCLDDAPDSEIIAWLEDDLANMYAPGMPDCHFYAPIPELHGYSRRRSLKCNIWI